MREKQFRKYLEKKYSNQSTISATLSDARAANRLIEGGLDNYFVENTERPLPNVLWDKSNKSAASHRGAANKYRSFLRESEGFNIEDTDNQDDFATETSRLSLEADLQESLRQNLSQLNPDLTVADDGSERSVATGRIDILARDSSGDYWVIELKAGTANEGAIAQLMAYMNALAEEEEIDIGNIRGLLVAQDFNNKVRHSARMVPTITLKKYGITFSFEDVS